MNEMKSWEELLRPVNTPKGWGYAQQFEKMVEENQEVANELRKYYDIACKIDMHKKATVDNTPEDLRNKKRRAELAAGVEAGDVIIAAAKLIHMIGLDLKHVLDVCYNKNKARGYYADGGESDGSIS